MTSWDGNILMRAVCLDCLRLIVHVLRGVVVFGHGWSTCNGWWTERVVVRQAGDRLGGHVGSLARSVFRDLIFDFQATLLFIADFWDVNITVGSFL